MRIEVIVDDQGFNNTLPGNAHQRDGLAERHLAPNLLDGRIGVGHELFAPRVDLQRPQLTRDAHQPRDARQRRDDHRAEEEGEEKLAPASHYVTDNTRLCESRRISRRTKASTCSETAPACVRRAS